MKKYDIIKYVSHMPSNGLMTDDDVNKVRSALRGFTKRFPNHYVLFDPNTRKFFIENKEKFKKEVYGK